MGWVKKAGRIYCPAPLPEEPADPLLTKMLVLTPYKAPKKKTEKEAKKTRAASVAVVPRTQDPKTPMPIIPPKRTGRRRTNPPQVERRKERPPAAWRPIRLRGEKLFFKRSPPAPPIAARSGIPGPGPW